MEEEGNQLGANEVPHRHYLQPLRHGVSVQERWNSGCNTRWRGDRTRNQYKGEQSSVYILYFNEIGIQL